MRMINLSIVIVSYNTKELLRQCLESILGSESDLGLEIIVVDNNSTDGSLEYLKKQKKLKLIENRKNFGFAKANNQGIKIAKGKYILLLNSDTIVKKDAFKTMVGFVEKHTDVGLVGPRLLNPNNTIQPSCFNFPSVFGAIKEFWLGKQGAFSKYAPKGNRPMVVDAVVGAAFLIPRTTIEKIGLLDEQYFMYFEDLDYCRRVWEAGFSVYYLPRSKILHLHGASGKELGDRPSKWLTRSSKIYHGLFKYYLINLIILSGQLFKRAKNKLSSLFISSK